MFLDHGEIYEHNYITFFKFGMLHPVRLPFMGRPWRVPPGHTTRLEFVGLGLRRSLLAHWFDGGPIFWTKRNHDPKIKKIKEIVFCKFVLRFTNHLQMGIVISVLSFVIICLHSFTIITYINQANWRMIVVSLPPTNWCPCSCRGVQLLLLAVSSAVVLPWVPRRNWT